MDNELAQEKNWWQQHRMWLTLLCLVLIICIGIVSTLDGDTTDYVRAYSDKALCQDAIDKSNKNQTFLATLGKLEPIDRFAILEGSVKYTHNTSLAEVTVRVSGSKGKAKMDILAVKKNQNWVYKIITLRVKKTGQKIQIQ